MSRTINGKEISKVMEELKVPFSKYAVDFNGRANIPYEVIRNRANDVLGLNYSDEIDVQLHEIEGEYSVRVTCKITLIDDEGNQVATRSHMRSDVLTRYSSDHRKKPNQICFDNDDFSSVVSLAFKKAFSMFGLGDQFALENANGSMNHVISNGKNDDPSDGMRRVKTMATFISKLVDDGTGEIYTFQSGEGKLIEFKVQNRESVKNYSKLSSLAPGSSAEVYFYLPDYTLFGVA